MDGIFKISINREITKALFCTRFYHSKVKIEESYFKDSEIKGKKPLFQYPKFKRKNNNVGYPEIKQRNYRHQDSERNVHPYRNIHYWKSRMEFIDDICKQVIYNKDGLVAINKPYGISSRPRDPEQVRKFNLPSGIVNEVDYTITDALPALAQELGYESLSIAKTPERFTTGVVLLSADQKVANAIDKSLKRAEGMRIIPRTYWTVTRRVPTKNEGEKRVAMKPTPSPENKRHTEPLIVSKWSEKERARGDIKILNVQFKILCTSTLNVGSLLEMKSSTTQWHAIRLFAAIILHSPILGDRIYGSRVQDVMGRFLTISPFVEAAHVEPKLDPILLKLLRINRGTTPMIPAHVHLREMFLPWFVEKGNDVAITAPIRPEFLWTCKQLQFDEQIYSPVGDEKMKNNYRERNCSELFRKKSGDSVESDKESTDEFINNQFDEIRYGKRSINLENT